MAHHPARQRARAPITFRRITQEIDVAKRAVNKKKKHVASKAAPKKSTRKTAARKVANASSKSASRKLPKAPKARLPKGPVWQWSALETAATIRSGAVSSVEVTEAHLKRMGAVNPKLNAVVVDLSDEALMAAKAADKVLAKGGALGLLHGVPITIKE